MRVRSITVEKLFGRFDHTIPLNMDERVTIVHGPNGFGKTALLKLVHALFNVDLEVLHSIPFESLHVDTDDDVSIVLRRVPASSYDGLTLRYALVGNGQAIAMCTGSELKMLKADFSSWRGRVVAAGEAVDAELAQEQDPADPGGTPDDHTAKIDQTAASIWLTRLLERLRSRPLRANAEFDVVFLALHWISVHLVSIERLFVRREHKQLKNPVFRAAWGLPERDEEEVVSFASAVSAYSKEFKDRVQSTQAEYTRMTQALDRTFPRRIMEAAESGKGSDEELKRELAALEERRSHLMTLGLLPGDDTAFQPPGESFDEATRKVMWIYVQDTKDKLGVFDELARKVDLLRTLISKRFQFKRLKIDAERGILFESDDARELPPTALSSGEQHELVMIYECLFRLEEDSLLLIDEPELSLHVAWQVEFLRDLLQMIELSHIDVLIATHSPQIIHDRWDLTVELKAPQAAAPVV